MNELLRQPAGPGGRPQVRRLGQSPHRPPERRADAGDARQRARRHERGAGQLYALTGEAKYLKLAERFNHMAVLGPASQRRDTLTGLHANTQIPKFIGTARQYELTGDDSLQTASRFFWDTVVKERSYVIGGNSDGEMFSPKEKLSRHSGPNTTETCNTYNMLKLTRHLFCWDPQAEYADYYERALYNHILASQNPETGMMCYYVPLRSGSRKVYNGSTTPSGAAPARASRTTRSTATASTSTTATRRST